MYVRVIVSNNKGGISDMLARTFLALEHFSKWAGVRKGQTCVALSVVDCLGASRFSFFLLCIVQCAAH